MHLPAAMPRDCSFACKWHLLRSISCHQALFGKGVALTSLYTGVHDLDRLAMAGFVTCLNTALMSAGAKLTTEGFMDAMVDVLKDDRQWHAPQLYPLLMLIDILESSRCPNAGHGACSCT